MGPFDEGGEEARQNAVARRLRARSRRMRVPINEVGAIVDLGPQQVLSAPGCAVQLELVRMFSTGLLLQILVIQRSMSAWAGPVIKVESMIGQPADADDAMWIGVQLADGTKATNVSNEPYPAIRISAHRR